MSKKRPSGSQDKIVVFGAKRIRRALVDGEWFFSVVDIVGALTDSANPRNYWNMMKAREKETSEVQLSTICVQLKLTSADGKLNRAKTTTARVRRFPMLITTGTRGRCAVPESTDPWDATPFSRRGLQGAH